MNKNIVDVLLNLTPYVDNDSYAQLSGASRLRIKRYILDLNLAFKTNLVGKTS